MTVSERLKVNSRVRVIAVTIRANYSPTMRHSLLKCLGATGTVIHFDPRFTLPYSIRFDDGCTSSFAENACEMLEPPVAAKGLTAWLVEAIGRHPAAEDDPAVIDAINAMAEALAGEPT